MIQLYQRRFPISVVKACCQSFYGRPLYPRTWKRWKNDVGIRGNIREVSYDEFFRIFEIINFKKSNNIISREDLEDILLKAIEWLDLADTYKGHQLPKVLKDIYGIEISFRQLYERVSGFALNKTYRIRDVIYLF